MKRLLISCILSFSLLACNNSTTTNENTVSKDTLTATDKDSSIAEPTVEATAGNLDTDAAATTDARAKNKTQNPETKMSLAEVLKSFEKKAQDFMISADRDTSIVCAEGTLVKIKGNSLINEVTGQPIVGKVKISVKEYYQVSDMITADLTTTSGHELLETGGMIYITATANNESCKLKKGKKIEFGFPYQEKKEGFKLFNGRRENGQMNWLLGDGVPKFISGRAIVVSGGKLRMDSTNKKMNKDFEQNTDNKKIHDNDAGTVNRYLLSSLDLGWINCDRFYKSSAPKLDFAVAGGEGDELQIHLIFESQKAIMRGQKNDQNYVFGKVPEGEKVKLIALKKVNNTILLASKETTLNKTPETDLKFEPVSIAMLKNEINRLNSN